MYTESTALEGGEKARLVSPYFPADGQLKCLRFKFNVNGFDIGRLSILDHNGETLWSFDNEDKKGDYDIKYEEHKWL